MDREILCVVTPDKAGKRLDAYLASEVEDLSRNYATKGSVSCVSIRYALNSGDAGDCTNQLRMHCMNSIIINISANQWIARINTKPMHYLHGLLVSWDG